MQRTRFQFILWIANHRERGPVIKRLVTSFPTCSIQRHRYAVNLSKHLQFSNELMARHPRIVGLKRPLSARSSPKCNKFKLIGPVSHEVKSPFRQEQLGRTLPAQRLARPHIEPVRNLTHLVFVNGLVGARHRAAGKQGVHGGHPKDVEQRAQRHAAHNHPAKSGFSSKAQQFVDHTGLLGLVHLRRKRNDQAVVLRGNAVGKARATAARAGAGAVPGGGWVRRLGLRAHDTGPGGDAAVEQALHHRAPIQRGINLFSSVDPSKIHSNCGLMRVADHFGGSPNG